MRANRAPPVRNNSVFRSGFAEFPGTCKVGDDWHVCCPRQTVRTRVAIGQQVWNEKGEIFSERPSSQLCRWGGIKRDDGGRRVLPTGIRPGVVGQPVGIGAGGHSADACRCAPAIRLALCSSAPTLLPRLGGGLRDDPRAVFSAASAGSPVRSHVAVVGVCHRLGVLGCRVGDRSGLERVDGVARPRTVACPVLRSTSAT
jgi:hypothetical protein